MSEGIDTIIENSQEDKLWELYLATLPMNEKSYIEWKASLQVNNTKENFETDIETIREQANNILKNTKPT